MSREADWQTIVSEIAARAHPMGFDLVAPVRVGAYNDLVAEGARLPLCRDASDLVCVVGNTRHLWPIFLRALADEPERLNSRHPLDEYVINSLSELFVALSPRGLVRWAHQSEPGHISMQTLAHISGMAYKTESWLSVHPRFGPWIALRAAAVFPVPGPVSVHEWDKPPCSACSRHCLPALARAREADGPATSDEQIRQHWRTWLAVRDACPLGREHRYSDGQIAYHYTKDVNVLDRICHRDPEFLGRSPARAP